MEDLDAPSNRKLRSAALRVTPQRRLIVEILSHAQGHLDAAEVYEQARQQDARLSLATVYRTLHALKQAGIVRELHLDDERHHYELDTADKHSHLVCLTCGRIIEVDSAAFARAARAAGKAHGFDVTRTYVELTGYCAECSREALIEAEGPAVGQPAASRSSTERGVRG